MLADFVARHRWKLLTWLWIGWGILTLLSRAAIVDIPLERDEGCFAYIAQQWRTGALPYRDIFDHKPPGIYAAYAAIQICLGESTSALRWGMFLHSIPLFVGLVLICRALTSNPYAGLWACAAASLYSTSLTIHGQSANCEMFAIVPGTFAFGLALASASSSTTTRARLGLALMAGVCCGAAPLYKHVAILFVGPVLITAVVSGPDRFKRFCLTAAGCLFLPSLFVAYFYLHGAGTDFVDCNWTYNRLYAGRVPLSYYPQLFFKIGRSIALTSSLIVMSAIVGAVKLVYAAVVRQGLFPKPIAIVTLLWVAAGCLLIVPGGTFFPHYFQFTVPAVSILVAVAFSTRVQSTNQLRWAAGVFALSLGQYLFIQGTIFLPHVRKSSKRIIRRATSSTMRLAGQNG